MKIAIATDHNGAKEKKEIIKFIEELGIDVIDCSTDNTPTDDYPDFAKRVCDNVVNNDDTLGILMCGTGIGMSIAANKVKGIRCGKVSSIEEAHLTKEHNHANVIAISYKEDIDLIKYMVKEFIFTECSDDERHIRRIEKIGALEK